MNTEKPLERKFPGFFAEIAEGEIEQDRKENNPGCNREFRRRVHLKKINRNYRGSQADTRKEGTYLITDCKSLPLKIRSGTIRRLTLGGSFQNL